MQNPVFLLPFYGLKLHRNKSYRHILLTHGLKKTGEVAGILSRAQSQSAKSDELDAKVQ